MSRDSLNVPEGNPRVTHLGKSRPAEAVGAHAFNFQTATGFPQNGISTAFMDVT